MEKLCNTRRKYYCTVYFACFPCWWPGMVVTCRCSPWRNLYCWSFKTYVKMNQFNIRFWCSKLECPTGFQAMENANQSLRTAPELQRTYSEAVMPGGRNVLSLEGSLPPLGSSWMTLGLDVSPPSAGDEKWPRGGRAVRVGFVWVKAEGRRINIGSDPCGRVVNWGLVSLGGQKEVALVPVINSGRVLVMEVRNVELGCGLSVRFEGLVSELE